MLNVHNLVSGYQNVVAVRDVSFVVGANEIVAIVGPNGSGKSTALKTVVGIVNLRAGNILLEGTDISKLSTSKIAKRGLIMVPENRGVFRSLTVEENLLLPLSVSSDKINKEEVLDDMYEVFPRLRERRKSQAESLSGGEQQMLVIGRALLAKPRLIMIDEPSLGLAPKITAQIYEVLANLRATRNLSILVVEQSANRVLEVADRVAVLREGQVQLSKLVSELAGPEELHAAYFGWSGHDASGGNDTASVPH